MASSVDAIRIIRTKVKGMAKLFLALTLGILAALGLSACSGGDPKPTPPALQATTDAIQEQTAGATAAASTKATSAPESKSPMPFTISESSYSISPVPGGSGSAVYIQWVAVLKNPNASSYGLFPTVTVTARDSSGAVVGTQDQVLGDLPPGTTIAFASQVQATASPATVDFSAGKVQWQSTKTKASDYAPFSASKVNYVEDRVAGYRVSGDIANPYGVDVKELAVTALVRDANGKLIGGRTTFVDGVPAKGSHPFSFTTGVTASPAASVDIAAMPWGGTADWNKLVAP